MSTKKTSAIPLTIIIPAYNEARTISDSLRKLAAQLKLDQLTDAEVIVSVGQGTDNTIELAQAEAKRFKHFVVLDNGKPSDKGRNVQLAMAQARGHKAIYMDADLATPLHHLRPMVERLDSADVVSGVRNIWQIHDGFRTLVSVGGNLMIRLFLLPRVSDSQCGFKGFRTDLARPIFAKQHIVSWGFDVEVLALAKKMGLRLDWMPIDDWHEVKGGGGLDQGIRKTFKAAWHTLFDILRIRYNLWTGAYGKLGGKEKA